MCSSTLIKPRSTSNELNSVCFVWLPSDTDLSSLSLPGRFRARYRGVLFGVYDMTLSRSQSALYFRLQAPGFLNLWTATVCLRPGQPSDNFCLTSDRTCTQRLQSVKLLFEGELCSLQSTCKRDLAPFCAAHRTDKLSISGKIARRICNKEGLQRLRLVLFDLSAMLSYHKYKISVHRLV